MDTKTITIGSTVIGDLTFYDQWGNVKSEPDGVNPGLNWKVGNICGTTQVLKADGTPDASKILFTPVLIGEDDFEAVMDFNNGVEPQDLHVIDCHIIVVDEPVATGKIVWEAPVGKIVPVVEPTPNTPTTPA